MSPDGPDKAVDPVLVNTLVYNQDERSQRFMTSMRCAVLSAFNTYLPEVVEVSDGEAEHFEQVLQRLDTAIDEQGTELAQFIREASDETIGDILHSCVTEVTSVIDTADDETEALSLHTQLQQALEQVRENLLALRENFDLDVFGDDRMFKSLESVGDRDIDAPLGSHAFVERCKRQPALSFDGEVEAERNLWEEAVQSTQASGRPEEQMPDPFRWSWTDDELFSEIKIPRVIVIEDPDENEELLWNELIGKLEGYVRKWKIECRKSIASNRTFTSSAGSMTRDEALDISERSFFEAMNERREDGFFRIEGREKLAIIWEKTIEPSLKLLSENLETFLQLQGGRRPTFIESALRDFYRKRYERERVDFCTGVSDDHIANDGIYYLPEPLSTFRCRALIAACVKKGFLRGASETDMRSSVYSYVKQQCKRRGIQMGDIHANLEDAINQLALSLEDFGGSMPPDSSAADSAELVCLLKEWLQEALRHTTEFVYEDLPACVLSDVKNSFSHFICWQIRCAAIVEPFQYGMDVKNEEYVTHMNDFYSMPLGEPFGKDVAEAVESMEEMPFLSVNSINVWWKNVWGDFQDRHALHDVVDANVEVVTTATSTVGTMVRDSVGRWEEESALESVASFETQLNILHQYLVEPGRFPSECTVEGATVELPVEDWKQYFAHQLEDMETQVRPVIAEREYVLTRRRLLSVEPCVETHLDATRSEMETMTAELTGYEGELTTGVSTTDIPFEDVDSLHEYAEGIAELACTVIQQNGDAESVSGSETIEGIFRPFFVAFQTTQEAYTSRETVLIDACKAQAEVLKLRHDNSEDQESIAELEGRLQSANEDNPYEALCSVQSHVRHISSVLEAIAQQQ